MASKRVFVSHAVNDKKLVDAFVDLLVTGANLNSNDVFCASLEGQGIPLGVNFIDYIKGQIQNPELVLLMLSQNYFDSLFCVCELGASWALSRNILPVVIPPLQFSDLKAVLANIQAVRIEDPISLTEARDRIAQALALQLPPATRWEAKRNAFVQKVKPLIRQQPSPSKVEFSKFDELRTKYEEGVKEVESAYEEIDHLKSQIGDLKRCKDKDEVAEVTKKYSSHWEQFRDLARAAREACGKLPYIVRDVLYHEVTEHEFLPEGGDIWDEIRSSVQYDFLRANDGHVTLNEHDPTVSQALDALHAVRSFLGEIYAESEDDEVSSFWQEFAEKHGYNPVFFSRRLWEEHLGLTRRF
jgi:hypothetical protein